MRVLSSGMIASARPSQPRFSAAAFTAGPPRSWYCPPLARSEMVMMPTTICISFLVIPSEVEESRGGTLKVISSGSLDFARDDRSCEPLLFFHQPYFGNLHLFVDGFAHVVNRQQSDRDAGERFHFDPGLRGGACRAVCADHAVLHFEIDFDVAQRQGMT